MCFDQELHGVAAACLKREIRNDTDARTLYQAAARQLMGRKQIKTGQQYGSK